MSDRLVHAVGAAVVVEWELVAAQVRQTGLAGTTTMRVFDEVNGLFTTPAVTELSLGGSPRAVYQATFTPDAAGQWHVTIDESSGPFAISESFEVVAAVEVDSARLTDIQGRLPATLSAGRMRSDVEAISTDTVAADALESVLDGGGGTITANVQGNLSGSVGSVTGAVGSVSAGGITAASIATDAIDSDAIAATAVTEIQSGLATSASIVTLQADTDDIQARLPATLSGGRMRAQVEGMDAGSVTAAAIATGAVDADALATDAVTEITLAVDAAVTASHGVGSYVDTGAAPSVGAIADAVWDELLAGHAIAGSSGEALTNAAAGGAGLTPQQVADALKLAPTAGAPAAGSVYGQIETIMGPGFSSATDSLEEIRDEVDACCGGGSGVDIVNIEGV